MKTSNCIITEARIKHGDKYTYPIFGNFDIDFKITIYCSIHGNFNQSVRRHLKGHGCRGCANIKNSLKKHIPVTKLVKKIRKVHGNKYIYKIPEDYRMNDVISIKCRKHGIFLQRIVNHLHGKDGCPKCNGGIKLADNIFFERSLEVHDTNYDYSKVIYKSMHSKVAIICKKCNNIFYQTPSDHLRDHGCPNQCYVVRGPGFKPNEPAITYYFKDIINNLFKIGITNMTVQKRFGQKKLREIKILKTWKFKKGADAYKLEQSILEEFSEFRVDNNNFRDVGGYTEFFNKDILNLDKGCVL